MPPLGLSSDEVLIVPHDEAWASLFEEEAARIRIACGPRLKAVVHVGSTAVPGLAAKPILDIMLGVDDFAEAEELVAPLEGLGYRFLGDFGIEGRLFFRRNEPCTHHVHIAEIGGKFWEDELLFRDTLRESARTAQNYEALKRQLAQRHHHDRPAYTAAKTDYITGVLTRARRARRKRSAGPRT